MKKIKGINIVKILATITIVLHHYQQTFYFTMPGKINFYEGSFYFGFVVELFFMISGLLAYHVYLEKGEDLGSFGKYMRAKFWRFFPLCFISITFFFLLQWISYFVTGESILWEVPTILDYLLSILFLDSGWGFLSYVPIAHVTWYIGVLLILHILFWIACRISKKYNIKMHYIAFALVILGSGIRNLEDYLMHMDIPLINQPVARGLTAFYTGIIVYILIKKCTKVIKLYSYIGLPIAAAALAYDYYLNRALTAPLIGSVFFVCVFIIYPSIITIFMTTPVINKISSYKIFDYLEAVSYPVYLWHFNCLFITKKVLDISGITINHGYKSMLVFVIIIYIICIPIYHYIELPLKKYVKEHILTG